MDGLPEESILRKGASTKNNNVTRFAAEASPAPKSSPAIRRSSGSSNNGSPRKVAPRRSSGGSIGSSRPVRRSSKTDPPPWNRNRLRSSVNGIDSNEGPAVVDAASVQEQNESKSDKDKILDHFFGDDKPSRPQKVNGEKRSETRKNKSGPYSYTPYISSSRNHTTTATTAIPNPYNPRKGQSNTKTDRFGFVLEDESSESESDVEAYAGALQRRHPSARRPKDPAKRISGLRKKRTATMAANKKNTTNVREKREKKWVKMIRMWDKTTSEKKKKAKLIKRVRKGIPDKMRGAAWSLLGDVPNAIDVKLKGKYDELLLEADMVGKVGDPSSDPLVQVRDTIERDIKRTFPKHVMFKENDEDDSDEPKVVEPAPDPQQEQKGNKKVLAGVRNVLDRKKNKNVAVVVNTRDKEDELPDLLGSSGGQASLRRVLRAYSMYDKETGYCQGMNFIAAMFITFMTEEEAFCLLVYVMNDLPCKMRNLFGIQMSQCTQMLHVAACLIRQFLPKLSSHFYKENVDISMYATQWLLTVYTSSFPFEIVTRVWDCFLSEGWKIVYRVMLAILSINEAKMLKMKFEGILGFLREVANDLDSDKVFEVAFKIPLKRKHVKKYEDDWLQQQR